MAKRKSSAKGIQWVTLLTGIALGVAFTLGTRQAFEFFAAGLVSERTGPITYENPEAQELSFRFFDMLADDEAGDPAQQLPRARSPVPTQGAAQEPPAPPDNSAEDDRAPTPVRPKLAEVPAQEASSASALQTQSNSGYVLQAGSFRAANAAETVRARILLLGLTSRIERVRDPEGGAFHRVIVGPYGSKEQMRDAAKRLRAEDIDTMGFYRPS